MAKTAERIKGTAVEAKEKAARKGLKSMVIQRERVDFEAEFKCTIKAEDHRARLRIPLQGIAATEGQAARPAPKVAGYFAVVKKDMASKTGYKVERHLVRNTEGLKKFLASDQVALSRLMESDPFATGTDSLTGSSTGLPPNNEYIPLMGGPFSKQLYLYDYLDMHAKCFQAKNHNPLAKEIIDVITFFTIGKGVKLMFANPQMQDGWDLFEKRNKFKQFIRVDSDSLTWAGELMTHKTKFADGFPCIRHIDPSTVWEIITEPKDIENVFYYHQQFPTQYQLVYKPGDVASEYVINDIPAEEVIHIKINAVPGEKRGRSDLFPILGWLKRFKDYYDAKITKAQIEESFVIKKKVSGSGADVDALFNDPDIQQVPNPGSVLIENDAINTEYMTPTTSSGNASENVGEAIRSICATGAGLSPEYLGVGGKSSTRATAITKSEPAERKFEDRQTMFELYIRDIADWWQIEAMKKNLVPAKQVRAADLAHLKKAIRGRDWKGAMKEILGLIALGAVTEPIDKSYEVIFPEISTGDRSAKIKDVLTAQVNRTISHERSSSMIAKELGISSYDYDTEQETIREEAADREADPSYNGSKDPALAILGKAQAKPATDAAPGTASSDKAFKDNKDAANA